MERVFIAFFIGIICLVAGKRLWDRGRGGQMTRDSIWVGIIGLGALGYAIITFVDLVTSWLDDLLTRLTNWVNSILQLSLSRPLALLLVIGIACLVSGIIGMATWYAGQRFREHQES